MKLLLSYIIGLFLILSLSACHDGGNATTLLHQADSLMQEFPDSALSLLESISHPEKLSGSERADYAIFLTRARTKLYVHESSDSLIRFAVDYYKRSWNNERKMQAYYYRGCVYRDMRCMDLAVKDFLQALKVIPKESEYLYWGPFMRIWRDVMRNKIFIRMLCTPIIKRMKFILSKRKMMVYFMLLEG